jgi:hypothetical protein
MPIDKRWERLTPHDWDAFASAWILQLRGESSSDRDYGQTVVMMNFTATSAQQWQFIQAAMRVASDEELGHIAAGPIEHLLGKHGEEYIDAVERMAEADPKFARMLLGVWRHMMSDEVWSRVEALKARCPQ